MVVRSKTRHSYEARVSSGTVIWNRDTCVVCALFDRVSFLGTVLTPGVPDGATTTYNAGTLAVRWIAGAGGNEFLRVDGRTTHAAIDTYDLELYDTTYFLPRFNNSSSQVTVLVVQNTTDAPVTGEIHFYDAGGALLSTQALSLAGHGVQILNSAAVPALAGQSGSVTIAHLGGYGALAGKGVALEPATGFTFDTALTPLPR
jgi:urease beta subunit